MSLEAGALYLNYPEFAQAAAPLVARLPDQGLDILERLQDALESGADLEQLEQLAP